MGVVSFQRDGNVWDETASYTKMKFPTSRKKSS